MKIAAVAAIAIIAIAGVPELIINSAARKDHANV